MNQAHTDDDEALPLATVDLIARLEKDYPPRCIYPNESEISAHRYAAQVELVATLRAMWEEQYGVDAPPPG